jgi:hypothetical protein
LQADQLLRERSHPTDFTAAPTNIHPHGAGIGPTQVCKGLRERRDGRLPRRIVFVGRHEHADPPHPLTVLRTRHVRPSRRANKPRDERSALH